jgi:hypothetical protein
MLIAEAAAATTSTSHFSGFDVFVLLFTLIIAIGVIRSIAAPVKNKFAIGWGAICLLVFLFLDVVMIMNWMGALNG